MNFSPARKNARISAETHLNFNHEILVKLVNFSEFQRVSGVNTGFL